MERKRPTRVAVRVKAKRGPSGGLCTHKRGLAPIELSTRHSSRPSSPNPSSSKSIQKSHLTVQSRTNRFHQMLDQLVIFRWLRHHTSAQNCREDPAAAEALEAVGQLTNVSDGETRRCIVAWLNQLQDVSGNSS